MTDPIRFTVQGQPVGQPKHGHRAVRQGRVWVAVAYPIVRTQPTKAHPKGEPHPILAWREAIARAVRPFVPPEPWAGPVRLDTEFYFERPEYMLARKYSEGPIWHDHKPDTDNLEKAVMDTLTDMKVWHDDGQRCCGEPKKWFAARGCGPGALVVLTQLTEPEPVLPFAEHKRTHVGGYKLAELPAPAGGGGGGA
jgi:Holliday junction resolvase RusA-like endonuclease